MLRWTINQLVVSAGIKIFSKLHAIMLKTSQKSFELVRKRDGRLVPFDQNRIVNAIERALRVTGEGDVKKDPEKVANGVLRVLEKRFDAQHVPHIEEIQDVVEEALIAHDLPKTAKSYILYRSKRAEVRDQQKFIPEHVKHLAEESKKYFRNELAEFIYYRTYSRWVETENRRETWIETVNRFMDFMHENLGKKLTDEEYAEVREAILNHEAMPSMRLMWSAGDAARKTNIAGYNCSFIAPMELGDFAEIMYILMCGTGVGFSVESHTAQQLPMIKRQSGKHMGTHTVDDSKEGWADALTLGLKTWYKGRDIDFDYSELRPAGARLKTMGGRSSGPEPLKALLEFTRERVLGRQGKRLRNIDVHDIVCKIGDVVVAGGVRRSALISLSDLDDEEMRGSKQGQFYLTEPQRALANNSAVYHDRPTAKEFLEEWHALVKSGTGERGIFNRGGLENQVPERRWKKMDKHVETTGTNPCGEIILRNKQFCNLSEVVARAEDTEETLLRKARIAAILGTYQSTLTDFPYIARDWKRNCEEERLLGVSVTGQWDSPEARREEILAKMRDVAVETNQEYAKRFGVNPSASVTCVKPSGTVSQLVDAASGMHARHAPYYIRRVRIAATDPLFHMLKEQKFPYHPEVGQQEATASTYVLEFPVKAPESSVHKDDLSAIDQLNHWKSVKQNFTEHNPSVTVSVGEDEWIETAHWLYKNWDMIGGLSFLPRADHVYQMAPYEEITEEQYHAHAARMPKVDFAQILLYEQEDNTQGAKELACVAGVCEVDVTEEDLALLHAHGGGEEDNAHSHAN